MAKKKLMAAQQQPLQFEDPAIPVDDDDDDDDDGDDAMDELEETNDNPVNASANHDAVVMPSRTSELTLSFEGEVYVFPSVTPQKVIILTIQMPNAK